MPAPVSMLSPGASALGASGGVGASAPAALGALDGPRVADGLGASAPERKPQGEEPEPEALFAQVSLSSAFHPLSFLPRAQVHPGAVGQINQSAHTDMIP